MMFVGIDPGKTGHIAMIDETGEFISDCKMPIIDGELAVITLQSYVYEARCVGLEQVQAMPGGGLRRPGIVSTFNFGRIFGETIACVKLCRVSMLRPRPQEWQKLIYGGRKKGKDPKETSRAVAAERHPSIADRFQTKVSAGLADALHLAEYARRLTIYES